MRKQLIEYEPTTPLPDHGTWLDLEAVAEVEISSEDPGQPIEGALLPGGTGWRAGSPGTQYIRLLFAQPQVLRRISLRFVETAVSRTQEFLLRWSADGGSTYRELVRQQWNFSPDGSTVENENLQVELDAVTQIELSVTPDIANPQAVASLAEWRLA
ncbi:MAG TPA: carbohydrate-binding protein [Accumulibacter sp.]|nr:carbohydrate-binding protein [Accumulibacter sp.]